MSKTPTGWFTGRLARSRWTAAAGPTSDAPAMPASRTSAAHSNARAYVVVGHRMLLGQHVDPDAQTDPSIALLLPCVDDVAEWRVYKSGCEM